MFERGAKTSERAERETERNREIEIKKKKTKRKFIVRVGVF